MHEYMYTRESVRERGVVNSDTHVCMHIISVHSYERVCACACASERVSARSRGVKTQKEGETSGWRDGGRVEERGRASAEKENL